LVIQIKAVHLYRIKKVNIMSINIGLKAIIIKDGVEVVDYFKCQQTRTKITENIISSVDIETAYRDYIIDFYKDWEDEEHIYFNDVPQSNEEPIEIIPINIGVSHLLKLDRFLLLHGDWGLEWFWC